MLRYTHIPYIPNILVLYPRAVRSSDVVRCSEAKQGMLRQRWAGFGIASATTSPWHGQDSVGNLDEPGVNLGWTWVTSNAKRHRNEQNRMFTEWKKTEQQWTAMNSNEQHQNLCEMRLMWLRFYFKLKRWVGWDQMGPDWPSFFFVKAC